MWFLPKAADPSPTISPTPTIDLSITLAKPLHVSGHQVNGLIHLNLKHQVKISTIHLTFKGDEHAAFWIWDRESSQDDASLIKKEAKYILLQIK